MSSLQSYLYVFYYHRILLTIFLFILVGLAIHEKKLKLEGK